MTRKTTGKIGTDGWKINLLFPLVKNQHGTNIQKENEKQLCGTLYIMNNNKITVLINSPSCFQKDFL